MTKKQVLKLAIEKAVKNGYKPVKAEILLIETDEVGAYFHLQGGLNYLGYQEIIFSHNFAKAFWGIGKQEKMGYKRVCYSPWKSNLQQMVLEKDPIKYLEKFL